MALHAQIMALSRQNTNVRSLALSLDEKRKLVEPCEESLLALQDALAKRGYDAATSVQTAVLEADSATRPDLPYPGGQARFPSVRLEGLTTTGSRFVAQMVVVTEAQGARVVQCASRNPVAPCEPILEHLVGRH